MDEKLTWSYRIAVITAKMSCYIKNLYRSAEKRLPVKACFLTFNTLVPSHLNYCLLTWGSAYKCNIEKLFATRKKTPYKQLCQVMLMTSLRTATCPLKPNHY